MKSKALADYLGWRESGEAYRRYGELSRSCLGQHRPAVERGNSPAKEKATVQSALLASEAGDVSSASAGHSFVVHR